MLKTLGVVAAVIVVGLPAAALVAGQMNMLSGRRPQDLGARDGLLKPPVAASWNSVSSQAARHPHTEYHEIAPLRYQGDGNAAFGRLADIVKAMPGATSHRFAARLPVCRIPDAAAEIRRRCRIPARPARRRHPDALGLAPGPQGLRRQPQAARGGTTALRRPAAACRVGANKPAAVPARQ